MYDPAMSINEQYNVKVDNSLRLYERQKTRESVVIIRNIKVNGKKYIEELCSPRLVRFIKLLSLGS